MSNVEDKLREYWVLVEMLEELESMESRLIASKSKTKTLLLCRKAKKAIGLTIQSLQAE